MIIGIGIDIVEIARIDRLYNKFQGRFLNKIFTQQEIDFCFKRKEYIASLSKMFSLKEATLKAISNTSGIKWQDIEITHDICGKPLINLYGKALERICNCNVQKDFTIHASVSDEKNYTVGIVLISNEESKHMKE